LSTKIWCLKVFFCAEVGRAAKVDGMDRMDIVDEMDEHGENSMNAQRRISLRSTSYAGQAVQHPMMNGRHCLWAGASVVFLGRCPRLLCLGLSALYDDGDIDHSLRSLLHPIVYH